MEGCENRFFNFMRRCEENWSWNPKKKMINAHHRHHHKYFESLRTTAFLFTVHLPKLVTQVRLFMARIFKHKKPSSLKVSTSTPALLEFRGQIGENYVMATTKFKVWGVNWCRRSGWVAVFFYFGNWKTKKIVRGKKT